MFFLDFTSFSIPFSFLFTFYDISVHLSWVCWLSVPIIYIYFYNLYSRKKLVSRIPKHFPISTAALYFTNIKAYYKTEGEMSIICDLQLRPNFGVGPAAGINGCEKCLPLRFLLSNICGHMVEVAVILRLRLTVQIQKLKFKLKSFKYKSPKCKSNLQ